MTTQLDIQYALMAGAAYRSNRPLTNRIPTPSGWDGTKYEIAPPNGSGFEAISFIPTGTTLATTNEIVISYAGTDFTAMGVALTDFVYGNIPLASGVSINGADQLIDAITTWGRSPIEITKRHKRK